MGHLGPRASGFSWDSAVGAMGRWSPRPSCCLSQGPCHLVAPQQVHFHIPSLPNLCALVVVVGGGGIFFKNKMAVRKATVAGTTG